MGGEREDERVGDALHHLDDEVRREVDKELREHLPGLAHEALLERVVLPALDDDLVQAFRSSAIAPPTSDVQASSLAFNAAILTASKGP
jgi:hypothetical protein